MNSFVYSLVHVIMVLDGEGEPFLERLWPSICYEAPLPRSLPDRRDARRRSVSVLQLPGSRGLADAQRQAGGGADHGATDARGRDCITIHFFLKKR